MKVLQLILPELIAPVVKMKVHEPHADVSPETTAEMFLSP
jgi:hypothetical protein